MKGTEKQIKLADQIAPGKEKWLVYEKYTGKIIAVSWSYERAERRAIQLWADCIKRDNYLPEWGGKNWKKGDILPLRNK